MMGCLIELFFEIFFELILYCYIKLMSLIVPDKVFTEQTKNKLKVAVTTVSAILGIILIIGIILLIQDDPSIKNIGKYMTYITLSIIGIQILLGIIVKTIHKH